MGGASLDGVSRTYKRPWYWLALLAIGTCAALALIAGAASSRIQGNSQQVASVENLQFEHVQTVADDFFADAAQLVPIVATTAGRVRANRPLEASLLAGMMEARRNRTVYGLGIFFAPYAFDANSKLYGPYFRKIGRHLSGISNDDPKTYNYPTLKWYRDAVAARGRVIIDGPYPEGGGSFISTLLAFPAQGPLRGVADVDARTDAFIRALASGLAPREIAYITAPNGTVFVATARLPAESAEWRNISGPIRFTHSTLHVLMNVQALREADSTIVATAIGAGLLVLAFSAGLWIFIFRLWRVREDAAALQEREARLHQEIATRAEVEVRLRAAAFTDELTGLPNRAYLRDRAANAIAEGTSIQLYLIDLDRFNIVNETFGHDAGDELLQMVAKRLSELDIGTPIRLGGDEFVLLVSHGAENRGIEQRIIDVLQLPFSLRGVEFYLGASIGIVTGSEDYRHADEYLRDADIALYEAKRAGRGCAVHFGPAMRGRAADELALEAELRRAIERREFSAHYQPIVDTDTWDVASFEALVRWNGAARGLVPAESFIAFAEQRGLVAQIDDAMLQLVSADAAGIFDAFPEASVAVNVSAAHLSDARLVGNVAEVLRRGDFTPAQLRIEITETAIMRNADLSLETLHSLRDLGVRIVVDDFGSGHSSLGYLQRLPISGLKIDRSFITPLAIDSHARAIVRSIVALGAALDLYIVAEGVEDRAQCEAARELGIRYLQGYYFAKPASAAKIASGNFLLARP